MQKQMLKANFCLCFKCIELISLNLPLTDIQSSLYPEIFYLYLFYRVSCNILKMQISANDVKIKISFKEYVLANHYFFFSFSPEAGAFLKIFRRVSFKRM